jgi:hypothetical protein
MFTMEQCRANQERSCIQVGAWLRDPYAIYDLQPASETPSMRKVLLNGIDMDLYLPPTFVLPESLPEGTNTVMDPAIDGKFLCAVETAVLSLLICAKVDQGGMMCRPGVMCRPGIHMHERNKHAAGMIDSLQRRHRSVSVLRHLQNEEYDKLLSENIVVLRLVDASAVNTALECAVRGTPFIVNRLPSLEELFGPEYPGFYNTTGDANMLASSWDSIQAIHTYIKGMDLDRLCLNQFVAGVEAGLYDATRARVNAVIA